MLGSVLSKALNSPTTWGVSPGTPCAAWSAPTQAVTTWPSESQQTAVQGRFTG